MTALRRCLAGWIEFMAMLVSLCVVTSGGCSKQESLVCALPEPQSPATADEAVRTVLVGLQRQELEALWDFLPPSYQNDLQKLVNEIGERFDEGSWKPFARTCNKARDVVRQISERRAISTDSPSEPEAEPSINWFAVNQFLDAFCDSQLANFGRQHGLDVRRFLVHTGNKLVAAFSHGALGDTGLGGNSFARFGDVKVELSESKEDSAVLTVQWPGQEPTRHEFVCIEKHWIPKSLAEAWPAEFPKVREQILSWADDLRANPEPWHARLREIDQLLDELAATKSLAETRQVWQAGVSRLAVAWFGATISEPPKKEEIPVESSPPAKPVRVKKPDTEVLLPDEPEK